jgi:hypothetical protein
MLVGLSYTNITVHGPSNEAIAPYLRASGRTAYVSPTVNGITVIYEREGEERMRALFSLAAGLSAHLACPALAAAMHDGDVLYYRLFERGAATDRYNSCPAYFTDGAQPAPEGGDAHQLAAAFDASAAISEVSRILREYDDGSGHPVNAEERHDKLVAALGLPRYAAGVGYYVIEAGTHADRYDGAGFTMVQPTSYDP